MRKRQRFPTQQISITCSVSSLLIHYFSSLFINHRRREKEATHQQHIQIYNVKLSHQFKM